MKRIIASIFFITLFAGFAAAMNPTHPVATPIQGTAAPAAMVAGNQAPTHPKVAAHMTVTGKITELSDTALKVERTVKGKAETMEFTLEKPLTGFAVGEEVVVKYHVKDGKNIAMDVQKPKPPVKK